MQTWQTIQAILQRSPINIFALCTSYSLGLIQRPNLEYPSPISTKSSLFLDLTSTETE